MDLISIYDYREIFFAWKDLESAGANLPEKIMRKYSNEHTFNYAIYRTRRV